MTAPPSTVAPHQIAGYFSISAVERDTGLSKDVLRVWERRYGFPVPSRDEHDERQYPAAQVERLRAIKRLMDAGHRPGKLLRLSDAELAAIASQWLRPLRADDDVATVQQQVLDALLQGQLGRVRSILNQHLLKEGLQRFVTDTLAPLNRAVSEANTRATLAPFHERAYVEQVMQTLRGAMVHHPLLGAAPRILLATLPNETSAVELLMVQAVLLPEGAACISLGTQVAVAQIAAAVIAFDADIVVLPFSASFSGTEAVVSLQALRRLLPDGVAVWAGGALMRRIRRQVPGVTATGALPDKLAALRQWRAEHAERVARGTGGDE